MHIENNDFRSLRSFVILQSPIPGHLHSTVDVYTFPVNLEATHQMLGGNEPAYWPSLEDYVPGFVNRGSIHPVLPPCDFFARLKAGKI